MFKFNSTFDPHWFKYMLLALCVFCSPIVIVRPSLAADYMLTPVTSSPVNTVVPSDLLVLTGLDQKPQNLTNTTDTKVVKEVNQRFLSVLPFSDMNIYVLNKENTFNLGIIPFLAGFNNSCKYSQIVQEYSIYRPVVTDTKSLSPTTPSMPSAEGISIRMVITVQSKDLDFGTLSIGALTMKATQNKLKAYISLQVVGITGQSITEATPMPSELTFTTLSAMYNGMDKIKQAIWTQPSGSLVFIRPQVIRQAKYIDPKNNKNCN